MKLNKTKKYGFFSNIAFSYKLLFNTKRSFIFVIPLFIIFSLIVTLISTYIPSLIVYFIENNFNIYTLLLLISSLCLLFIVIKATTDYLNEILSMGYLLTRATIPFLELSRKALSMDYQLYESKKVKDALAKAEYGVSSNLRGLEGLYRKLPLLIIAILGFLIFGISTIFISYYVLIIVLVVFIINFILIIFVSKKHTKIGDDISKVNNKIRYFSNASENEVMAKDIRNYSLSSKFISLLSTYHKELRKHLIRLNFLWFIPSFELTLGALIRDLIAYAFLIYQAINNLISISEFVALFSSITAFNSYLDQISLYLDENILCSLEVKYFREFFDIKNDFNHGNNKDKKCIDINLIKKPFEIDIKNISFKYDGSDKYIFKDFSLKIRSGEKIALVGINGAGKTTLAKLLTGLYYPSEGEILVNGVNIKDLNIDKYYSLVSIINQDIYPLAFTIKDNIICSYPYDEVRFNKVIEEAGIKERINSLKDKENTFITQNFSRDGINLSGGELQKMFLARALYKTSYFLILDEPTSALDPIAEGELYSKYNELVKDKTSIFISHRLSSTRFCDEIYFLENGKIIEKGSHEELMKKEGEYFKMFNLQAKYYKENLEEGGEK